MKNLRFLCGLASFLMLLSTGCPGGPMECARSIVVNVIVTFDPPPAGKQLTAVGDVTGDGRPDIVVAYGVSEPGSFALQYLDGQEEDGTRRTFGGPHVLEVSGTIQGRVVDFGGGDTVASDIAVGDLDGDGIDEVAVSLTNPATGPVLLIVKAGATVGAVVPGANVLSSAKAIAAGDLDGDGVMEVVAAYPGAATKIDVFSWKQGLDAEPARTSVDCRCHVLETSGSILTARSNFGDGVHNDLVLATDAGVSVIVNPRSGGGGGGGAGGVLRVETLATAEAPASVAAGDLDGDGRLDIVALEPASGTMKTFMAASGALGYDEALVNSLEGEPTSVAIADVDADGLGEAFVTNDFTNAGGDTYSEVSVFGFDPVPITSARTGRGSMIGAPKKSFAQKLGKFGKGPSVIGVTEPTSGSAEVVELSTEETCSQ